MTAHFQMVLGFLGLGVSSVGAVGSGSPPRTHAVGMTVPPTGPVPGEYPMARPTLPHLLPAEAASGSFLHLGSEEAVDLDDLSAPLNFNTPIPALIELQLSAEWCPGHGRGQRPSW